jgi:tetratricopeptide (TPR) repeat protein
MYNIIPLIIICLSFFAILFIVVRKFPAAATLDVENMPAEKEMRFKEKIAASRLERVLARWKMHLGRFFGFFGNKISLFLKWLKSRLKEEKKKYVVEKLSETIGQDDKNLLIKSLFSENQSLDDGEDFEKKEANLIKIIGLDANNIEAFNLLGELYFLNRKNEEAKQSWAHAIKLLDDEEIDKQAEIYNNLAILYKDSGSASVALEMAKMASKLVPHNPRYLDSLIEISIMNKDKNSAEDGLMRLVEVNPENGKIEDFKKQIKELE